VVIFQMKNTDFFVCLFKQYILVKNDSSKITFTFPMQDCTFAELKK